MDGFPEAPLRKSKREKSLKKKILSKKRVTKFFKRLSVSPRDSRQNAPYLLQVENTTHSEAKFLGAELSEEVIDYYFESSKLQSKISNYFLHY